MRLIDADALIAKAYIMQEPNGFIHSVVTERQIVGSPTIDAVPVVRCEKCACFEEATGKDSGKPVGYGRCRRPFGLIGIVSADDFCSYGERRSE